MRTLNLILVTVGLALAGFIAYQKLAPDPWTKAQLLEPAELARILNDPKAEKPIVYCLGPQALIKGSVDVGPGQESASIQKLEKEVAKLPKDAHIVIYCGCCPLWKCPNVRPAFNKLTQLGYTHHKMLNLNTSVKADWMDKGYPVQE